MNETEMQTGIWPTGLYLITLHNILYYLFAWSLFHVFIRQAWASMSKMLCVSWQSHIPASFLTSYQKLDWCLGM